MARSGVRGYRFRPGNIKSAIGGGPLSSAKLTDDQPTIDCSVRSLETLGGSARPPCCQACYAKLSSPRRGPRSRLTPSVSQSNPKVDVMAPVQGTPELARYLDLKLAALGQPTAHTGTDDPLLQTAGPLLRSYFQKDQLLGQYLCPADMRIQSFLDSYLREACPGGAPRLPANAFVLDREGLARVMSLPPGGNTFSSPYLKSYRIPQGVLHNPLNDRRTTQGVFHIAENGFPVPADKQAVPIQTFAALLAAAFQPPPNVLTLPFTAGQPDQARLFVLAVIAAPGLSGDRRRSGKDHGNSLLCAGEPGKQSRFRRSDLRQRRRSESSRKRRRAGRSALDRSYRLRDCRAAHCRSQESRPGTAATRPTPRTGRNATGCAGDHRMNSTTAGTPSRSAAAIIAE